MVGSCTDPCPEKYTLSRDNAVRLRASECPACNTMLSLAPKSHLWPFGSAYICPWVRSALLYAVRSESSVEWPHERIAQEQYISMLPEGKFPAVGKLKGATARAMTGPVEEGQPSGHVH
ncbi:hypothetical protein PMIN06_006046 [Paraphaeosphaeria minitans]